MAGKNKKNVIGDYTVRINYDTKKVKKLESDLKKVEKKIEKMNSKSSKKKNGFDKMVENNLKLITTTEDNNKLLVRRIKTIERIKKLKNSIEFKKRKAAKTEQYEIENSIRLEKKRIDLNLTEVQLNDIRLKQTKESYKIQEKAFKNSRAEAKEAKQIEREKEAAYRVKIKNRVKGEESRAKQEAFREQRLERQAVLKKFYSPFSDKVTKKENKFPIMPKSEIQRRKDVEKAKIDSIIYKRVEGLTEQAVNPKITSAQMKRIKDAKTFKTAPLFGEVGNPKMPASELKRRKEEKKRIEEAKIYRRYEGFDLVQNPIMPASEIRRRKEEKKRIEDSKIFKRSKSFSTDVNFPKLSSEEIKKRREAQKKLNDLQNKELKRQRTLIKGEKRRNDMLKNRMSLQQGMFYASSNIKDLASIASRISKGVGEAESRVRYSEILKKQYGNVFDNDIKKLVQTQGMTEGEAGAYMGKYTGLMSSLGMQKQKIPEYAKVANNNAMMLAGTLGVSLETGFDKLENIIAGETGALDRAGIQLDLRDITKGITDPIQKTQLTLKAIETYLKKNPNSKLYAEGNTIMQQQKKMAGATKYFMEKTYKINKNEILGALKSVNNVMYNVAGSSKSQSLVKTGANSINRIFKILPLLNEFKVEIGLAALALYRFNRSFYVIKNFVKILKTAKRIMAVSTKRGGYSGMAGGLTESFAEGIANKIYKSKTMGKYGGKAKDTLGSMIKSGAIRNVISTLITMSVPLVIAAIAGFSFYKLLKMFQDEKEKMRSGKFNTGFDVMGKEWVENQVKLDNLKEKMYNSEETKADLLKESEAIDKNKLSFGQKKEAFAVESVLAEGFENTKLSKGITESITETGFLAKIAERVAQSQAKKALGINAGNLAIIQRTIDKKNEYKEFKKERATQVEKNESNLNQQKRVNYVTYNFNGAGLTVEDVNNIIQKNKETGDSLGDMTTGARY